MIGQPQAPVIVLGSHKGGVGRTVTAVNLAAMFAQAGRRTLLVDFDPKGDATANVGLPRAHGERTLERLADPDAFVEDCRPASCPPGLDVLPGGPVMEKLQARLWRDEDPPIDLLKRGLQVARQRYRVIVVDALPALDPLGCNALAAADVLLLPLSGTAFSTPALCETIEAAERVCTSKLLVVGVRIGVRKEEMLSGRQGLPPTRCACMVLDSGIAYDAHTLLQATERGLPVFEYAPGSRVARSFIEFGREMLARVVERPAVPSSV
ncbi:MAG: ParA family protein [Planctomycetes bacterium]|nr:ParA family protein [Planctomycetota bacterium]